MDRASGESQFRESVLPHVPDLLGSALRLTGDWDDAQVLAQDALVMAYRDREGPGPDTDFGTWLLTVMVSTYMGRNRTGRPEAEPGPAMAAPGLDRPTAATRRDEISRGAPSAERIQAALNTLPEELRVPLLLCDVESMSYSDIAHALGIPLGAVRARVFLGRQRLQDSLTDQVERGSG